MSQKAETQFIHSIHKEFKAMEAWPHHQKMFNPLHAGTPDVYYSGRKSDLWVEYKWLNSLDMRKVKFRPNLSGHQKAWLEERVAEGRNCAVIVGSPFGGVILRVQDWQRGIPYDSFLKSPISPRGIAEWIFKQTGPTGWNRFSRHQWLQRQQDSSPSQSSSDSESPSSDLESLDINSLERLAEDDD